MGNVVNLNSYRKQKSNFSSNKRTHNSPYLVIVLFVFLFVVLVKLLEGFVVTPVTYSLIGVNCLIFGLIWFKRLYTYQLWTSYSNTIERKEYYRIITSAFTHQEIWHILMNMASLQNLGEVLEPFLGRRLFIIAYASIMIVGGVLSCLVHKKLEPNVNSIGASGVLCGLMGIYLVIAFRLWGIAGIKSCAMSLIFLVLMLFSKRIDNIGHFTGLFTGIVFGYLLFGGAIL